MYKLYILIFLAVTVLICSCTEEIDMKFKTAKPQLIVDGYFTDQLRNHYVRLSVSSGFLSNEANPPVSDALVSLSDGVNKIELGEMEDIPGTYIIPQFYRGVYGKTYTLSIDGVDVDNDGQTESYQASNTMNPVAPIDSIKLNWSEEHGQKFWQIQLYTLDPEETKDFYAFAAYLNGESITTKLSELNYAEDKYFNGNQVRGIEVQAVIEENEDGEEEHVLKEGDWVKLEMQNINEDYYDYLIGIDEETGIKVPLFSGPPANVPTNVSNNGIGFFRVYSVMCDSVQVTREILGQRD